MEENYIELIAGYLTGQLSDEHREALHAWIKADKRNKRYFDGMRELWLAAPTAFHDQPFDGDAAYRLFLTRMQTKTSAMPIKRKSSIRFQLFRVAAAVTVGFLLGAFLRHLYNPTVAVDDSPPIATHNDIIVPLGSRSRVVLADGSQVWVNAGSRLRYATDFGRNTREVYLEGEAYFDVATDSARLFVVKTDKLDVKALGTSFNVKAYPGEENIETVLVSGKVSIGDVVLEPNEKLIYTKKDNHVVIEKKISETKPTVVVSQGTNKLASSARPTAKIIETQIDPAIYASWKDDLWRIESETLGSFAVKLERRYDVKIQFADKSTQSLSINATIRDESLEQVLRFLQLTFPVDFSINGKTVVLKENKYLKQKYQDYYKQK